MEQAIKTWLSANVRLLPATLERWSTADMEVGSVDELLSRVRDRGNGK